MADTEETTTTTTTTTEEEVTTTEVSSTEPPATSTVTSVSEKIVLTKQQPRLSPAPEITVPTGSRKSGKSSSGASVHYSSSTAMSQPVSSSSRSSYKSSSRTFREYTDTHNLLSDLTRDYRGTSPSVLENIATHPVLYSRQYMPEKFKPSMSARSRKVIRDAEELAHITPGLKLMLEVQYSLLFVLPCPVRFRFLLLLLLLLLSS